MLSRVWHTCHSEIENPIFLNSGLTLTSFLKCVLCLIRTELNYSGLPGAGLDTPALIRMINLAITCWPTSCIFKDVIYK